jgi:hypothetical protein
MSIDTCASVPISEGNFLRGTWADVQEEHRKPSVRMRQGQQVNLHRALPGQFAIVIFLGLWGQEARAALPAWQGLGTAEVGIVDCRFSEPCKFSAIASDVHAYGICMCAVLRAQHIYATTHTQPTATHRTLAVTHATLRSRRDPNGFVARPTKGSRPQV